LSAHKQTKSFPTFITDTFALD